jgi:hypothetical protein
MTQNWLRPIVIAGLIIGSAGSCLAGGLPTFDTQNYCRGVADAVGGSYEIELGCRNDEENAISELQQMDIPKRIARYCTGVGNAVGGSYEVFEGCINDELRARDQLDN